ncbi:NAD-binding protein, partial [uncultured Acidovorax sp.]|uniref:NAD-binding protein n=1 Tax=uncultured Acidovorax sp. TaxID=158751 RepID=UPI002586B1AA
VDEVNQRTGGGRDGVEFDGTDLMLKDLGLAQENAAAVKASTPLGGLARNLYAMHSIAGNGALDFSSIIKTVLK